MRFAILVVLMGLAVPPALAQNGTTLDSLELYPTWNNIGVRVFYTGDVNANAGGHLEWRVRGDIAWRRGVNLTRIANGRFAASVIRVAAGQDHDVRAVVADPDGGSGSLAGIASTRPDPAHTPPPAGRTWWVATTGSDANPGTSTQPFATLQAAADRAVAGEEIRVKPGLYHQSLDSVRPGTESRPIRLVADGPGVILDGSNPAHLHRADWQNDGGGLYSIPFPDSTRLICADSLQRLYRHSSVANLQAGAGGITQGWTIAGGRLHLRLEDGSSPAGHTIHVAHRDFGIRLRHDHWWVEGFEVRYFGLTAVGFDYISSGILLSVARRCVVRNNHVHTIGGRPIFLRDDAGDNLVEGNLVRDPRIDAWALLNWDAVKGHPEEITAISNRGGRGNVIRGNTIRGTFNGIDARESEENHTEAVAADCDVVDNDIAQVGDDAFEIDVISGINTRWYRNVVDDIYVGCSIAPIDQGPTYVLYNQFTRFRRSAWKFSLGSVGHAWICHNTSYTAASARAAVHPSGLYSNMHFRNNILYGNGRECVSDDSGESLTGNDFDGDLLVSVGTSTLFRWKNTNYGTIAALRSATGFELAGRAGSPGFVNAAGGDFTLQPGSLAVDGGVLLPGINDTYAGAAPDMGCYERALPVDVLPPTPRADVALEAPWPNPARGAVHVRWSVASARRVRIAVLDLAGREVRVLVDGFAAAGAHEAVWDGRDRSGERVAPGMYAVRASSRDGSVTRAVSHLR
jgi:hypothetical protein